MKKLRAVLSILIFLIVLTALFYACDYPGYFRRDNRLAVHFIDVGQGDATLIISPQGETMLIDAGNNTHDRGLVSYLKACEVKKIDVLIGTHPDSDHIGGMDTIIYHFPIKKCYMPMKYHETKSFNDVLFAAKKKGLKIQPAYGGETFSFADGILTGFLSPVKDKYYQDNNAYSAVVKLQYGNTAFLFMGDADKNNERDMMTAGYDVSANVLKLGHHGSSSSTSERFLEEVSPRMVISSSGYKNAYGHPHKEVLQLLKQHHIPLYRTDEQGDIVVHSNGQVITVNQKPGSYTYRKP